MKPLAALVCGFLFGAGLTVSGMTDPARVIGFLDVFGNWDPALGLVMAGALLVTLPAYHWVRRAPTPLLDQRFFLPERTRIDSELIQGAAIFGVGWGIAGFCPGPALAGLASASPDVLIFVLAMATGMALRNAQLTRGKGIRE